MDTSRLHRISMHQAEPQVCIGTDESNRAVNIAATGDERRSSLDDTPGPLNDDVLTCVLQHLTATPLCGRLAFSQVCRQWRCMALEDAALWSHITITGSSPVQKLRCLLPRSKTLDLSVFLHFDKSADMELGTCANPDGYRECFEALLPHTDRIRRFYLQYETGNAEPPDCLFNDAERVFSRLVELVIMKGMLRPASDDFRLSLSTPALECLHIRGAIPASWVDIASATLRELRLTAPLDLSSDDVLGIFSLSSLRVFHYGPSDRRPLRLFVPISWQKVDLDVLSLECWTTRDVLPWFDLVDVVATRTIMISTAGDVHACVRMCRRLFSGLGAIVNIDTRHGRIEDCRGLVRQTTLLSPGASRAVLRTARELYAALPHSIKALAVDCRDINPTASVYTDNWCEAARISPFKHLELSLTVYVEVIPLWHPGDREARLSPPVGIIRCPNLLALHIKPLQERLGRPWKVSLSEIEQLARQIDHNGTLRDITIDGLQLGDNSFVHNTALRHLRKRFCR